MGHVVWLAIAILIILVWLPKIIGYFTAKVKSEIRRQDAAALNDNPEIRMHYAAIREIERKALEKGIVRRDGKWESEQQ